MLEVNEGRGRGCNVESDVVSIDLEDAFSGSETFCVPITAASDGEDGESIVTTSATETVSPMGSSFLTGK